MTAKSNNFMNYKSYQHDKTSAKPPKYSVTSSLQSNKHPRKGSPTFNGRHLHFLDPVLSQIDMRNSLQLPGK